MERINQKKVEQLDDYIREGKLKPALKLVESRQKKGDKSDSLLVQKIIVLISFQEKSRREQGMKELEALTQRKPHITDHQALKRLDLFLAERKDRDEYANNLWAAAGAGSQDEEFLSTWFRLKFDQERWEAAQKAAQTWQKATPQKRIPFFMWILSSHLVSINPGISEMSRKLAQGFAYRLLAKAALEVPQWKGQNEQDPPSPPRALKTEQDLLLLLEVYIAQCKYSEALAILEDPRTGFLSHLSQNKWEIARYMIGLYELSENWKGEWNLCSAILVNARPDVLDKMDDDSATYNFGGLGDDWRVWDGLVTACGKLASTPDAKNYADRTETIINNFCSDHRPRNAVLANIKLHSIKSLTDANHQRHLVSICETYFSNHCSKVACFQDLRPYVSCLDRDNQAALLQLMKSCAHQISPNVEVDNAAKLHWITAETNVFKFEYHFVTSRNDNSQVNDFLPAFICSCLRLYKVSVQFDFKLPPSDRLPGDDAAILAAMALIRMHRLREQKPAWSYSIYRCIALLEFALNKSKHNYDILLILVRVYASLGAGSLAMARYSQLSIKNLQHLTISWMLFTRLSTIHPHPVTIPGLDGEILTIDPLKEAIDVLNWHRRAYQLNRQSMEGFRANNQWMMELDALETKSALQDSFSRLLLLAESSRMRRFRYPKGLDGDNSPQPTRLSQIIKDTRDSAAFPNYEADGQPKFWEICPSVEVPGMAVTNQRWLASNIRQTLIWASLRGKDDSNIEASDFTSFSQQYHNQEDATSTAEEILFSICDLVQRGLDQLHSQGAKGGLLADSVGQILLQVNAVLKEGTAHATYKRDDPPGSLVRNALHDYFCTIEICQFVVKFADVIQQAERSEIWMAKMLADLQVGCKKILAVVSKCAIDCRADIESQSFFDALYQKCSESDDVGRELNHLLVNPVSMHKVMKMLQESWIDAFEGVIKTKVVD